MSKKNKHKKNINQNKEFKEENNVVVNDEAIESVDNEELASGNDTSLPEEAEDTMPLEDAKSEKAEPLTEDTDIVPEESKEEIETSKESKEEPENPEPADEKAAEEPTIEEEAPLAEKATSENNEEDGGIEEVKEEEISEESKEEAEEKIEEVPVVPVEEDTKELDKTGKDYEEKLEALDKIEGKYRIFDYIESGYPFNRYDLIDVLRSDLEKCIDEDFESIFHLIVNTELIRDNEVVGMFVYFAVANKYEFNLEKILNSLPEIEMDIVYYYAALNAIRYNEKNRNKKLIEEFATNLRSINRKSVALGLFTYHKKYRVYQLYDADDSYKAFKKISALYKKILSKGTPKEKRLVLKDIFDIYGLTSYKKYDKGIIFYDKCESNLDDDLKEYALLRIAHNFLIHFEFSKAIKTYEKILSFTSDKFNAKAGLMLANNKVRIYGELNGKLKYYDTEEFKDLLNEAVKNNLKAYTDRFLTLINEIKSQERYELEYKMGQIRRIVSGFCYVLMVMTLILGFFIKMKPLIITEGILAAIIIGIQFLTIRLKKRLIPIIIYSSIAIVFFILSIILI